MVPHIRHRNVTNARRLVDTGPLCHSIAGSGSNGNRDNYVETRFIAAPTAINPSRLRLGVVGFLDPHKDPLPTLEVLDRLPNAHLTFLGGPLPGDDETIERVLAAIERLGLSDRVRVTGYLTDGALDSALSEVDIGLCLYRAAATSACLSTLLATARPIVATNRPLFEEYAAAAPRSVVVVERDADLAASAIQDLAARAPNWGTECWNLDCHAP